MIRMMSMYFITFVIMIFIPLIGWYYLLPVLMTKKLGLYLIFFVLPGLAAQCWYTKWCYKYIFITFRFRKFFQLKGGVVWGRDAYGRIHNKQTYDLRDNITELLAYDGHSGIITEQIIWTYNPKGNPLTRKLFNARGNLVESYTY